MQTNRSFFISLGSFLCAVSLAFAISLPFYTSGTLLLTSEIVLLVFAVLGVFSLIKGLKLPKSAPLSHRDSVLRITVTAVMLGFVAVSKIFRLEVPMFGGAGMSIGFSGIFTSIPALLFGPLYGAVASASSDILGCIISPIGAYNPLFTLTAFIGGFIKGSVWLLIKDRTSNALRIFSVSTAVLLIAFGTVTGISVRNDGISKSLVASADQIPSEGVISATDRSTLTDVVTSLASYNKDVYTLTGAENADIVTVPEFIEVDGIKYTPKIGKNALKNVAGDIYIPSGITKIDSQAFAEGATVYIEEESAKHFEGISGITLIYKDGIEKTTAVLNYGGTDSNGFTLSSNNAYANALAKYVNYLTLGPIIMGGSMLIMMAIGYAVKFFSKKQGKQRSVSAMRVLVAVFAAGLVATTVNTVILQHIVYPSWASRAFMIIWIPRVAEELIVCSLQSYFIALLYDFYMSRQNKT